MPVAITTKALATATQEELATYLAHCQDMGDAWVRKQVIEFNRIDILSTYVLGLKIQPFHLAMQRWQFTHPDNLQLVFRGAGKCVGKGTTFLMHDGSVRRVEDIKVGDVLMGPDSRPRRVESLHRGIGEMFKVTPQKGEPWTCNSLHEIPLTGVGNRGFYANKFKTATAPDIISSISKLKRPEDWQWKLYKSPKIEFLENPKPLPFHPYLFGLWLGDGDKSGTRITNSSQEIHDWVKSWCNSNGYVYNDHPGYIDIAKSHNGSVRVNPFLDFIRSTEDKHIPISYLTASTIERMQLLAGLVDTDGYVPQDNCYIEISQVRKHLAESIAYLARSLGFACYVKETVCKIKKIGFEGLCYNLNIVGDIDNIPTILKRKKAPKRESLKDVRKVGILAVEPIGDGEYFGFQVSGPDSLIVRGDFTVDHNSTTCTVAKSIHLLLKNPNLRIIIASKTSQNAEGFLTEIKNHFENNTVLSRIFGKYYDARKCPKWDNREIIVFPRTALNKESSITCVGVEGTVVSKHYDVAISDDLVDEENSRTQYMRDKTRTWYYQTYLPVIEPPDPEVMHRGEHHRQGTRYHYADLYGHLIENELKEHTQRIQALSEHGQSPWPEKYPPEWFLKRKRESGMIIFNAQYQNDTEAMKGEIFQYDYCQQVEPKAWPKPEDLRIFMGVDLAISEKESADKFAIVVIGALPDGSGIFVLDFYEGQLRFKAQTEKIIEYYNKWDPIKIAIETNQYQEAQYQNLKDELPDIRVKQVKQEKDKITRAMKLSALFEDRKVFFRKGQQDLLIEHLVLFPNHRYKDLFDAFDLAVTQARGKRRRKSSRNQEPGVI